VVEDAEACMLSRARGALNSICESFGIDLKLAFARRIGVGLLVHACVLNEPAMKLVV
jgi:hypothetical protein